jgi:hypothetical protein
VGLLPGISLGTGGGVFFLYSSVLEAFFTWGLILKDCGRDMAAATMTGIPVKFTFKTTLPCINQDLTP